MFQDVRYTLRGMRLSPGFTAVAVISLALGIGANTAIFSFLDAIIVRWLPVQNPESLVTLNWHTKDRPTGAHRGQFVYIPDSKGGFAGPTFPFAALELLADNTVFSNVFAYSNWGVGSVNLIAKVQPELVNGQYVSGEFFSSLGVRPAAGRLIDASDDRTSAPPIAIISFALWQRRFGGSTDAISQSIVIENVPFTIAGVTPVGSKRNRSAGIIPGGKLRVAGGREHRWGR